MGDRGRMRLGAYFNPTGHHVASWRHPRAHKTAHVDVRHYVEIAQTAEKAKFDMIFLADSAAVRKADIEAQCRSVQFIANFEPITLLSAIAMMTSKIGLVATASTSFNEPYHVARKFASLDHISGGRAAWNVVTSGNSIEHTNFNRDKPIAHAERYARGHEFVDVVTALWDSFEDDAFVRDTKTGIFFQPEKMHTLNHKGERYSVRGPLNVPRSPQGWPVMVQAGASDEGKELAAQYAEAIFSPHVAIPPAKTYYDDLKARMPKYGRHPDHMKILPGLSVIVAPTYEEAKRDYDFIQSLIHPIVAREILSTMLGDMDLTRFPIDEPLPEVLPPTNGSKGHYESIIEMARRENLTISQLGARVAGARGKNVVVGDPRQIADLMEEWFVKGACDGFNVMPPYLPGQLDDFCTLVIPELQRRGLFRTEYEGATLRENLGLPRPKNRYA